MQHLLSAFDITKTYRTRSSGKVQALRGIRFQVREGEIYGFLGPNGSGKTTTLRILLGLLHPDEGRLSVLGSDEVNERTRARIGYVPENAVFPEFLTCSGILNMVCSFQAVPTEFRPDLVDGLLAEVGLEHESGRTARELSRGQRQRLALASALVGSPRLLVLDEPTSGFDPLGRKWFKDYLRTLRGKGVTVLISSHLLAEIEEVCDRVGIIHAGRVLAEGTVAEIVALASRVNPNNPVTSLEDAFVVLIKESSGGEDLDPRVHHRL